PLHAFAAVYVGFAVALGQRTVARADEWFAHRFAGTPRPAHDDRDRLTREWALFRRAAVAWAVASAILVALTAVAGDFHRSAALLGYIGVLSVALALWYVIGPLPAQLAARRASPPSIKNGNADMERNKPSSGDRVWAPWWLYLVVILGANYARQAVMPFGAIPEWAVVLVVLAGSAALFAIVTAAYRLARR
ncbi:MAG TPA: hypothetical protein VE666_06420, partial [Mycobacterium sp.]|nr:hypothetical protein [Mycobacterium sp.]